MVNPTKSSAPGRPRAFDADAALEQALRLFWEKGYEGASLTDLTKVMGINRPSLYAAFGNKEELFRKALARYSAGPASYFRKALEAPTGRAVVQQLFRGAMELLCSPGSPRGCLAVQGALACGDDAGVVRRELIALRAASQEALRVRLVRARADGDLPKKADPAKLARFICTVLQGMAVQSSSGASREDLLGVAELAVAAWPK